MAPAIINAVVKREGRDLHLEVWVCLLFVERLKNKNIRLQRPNYKKMLRHALFKAPAWNI